MTFFVCKQIDFCYFAVLIFPILLVKDPIESRHKVLGIGTYSYLTTSPSSTTFDSSLFYEKLVALCFQGFCHNVQWGFPHHPHLFLSTTKKIFGVIFFFFIWRVIVSQPHRKELKATTGPLAIFHVERRSSFRRIDKHRFTLYYFLRLKDFFVRIWHPNKLWLFQTDTDKKITYGVVVRDRGCGQWKINQSCYQLKYIKF